MTYPLNENFIVYDGECPFCASYVKLQRLRKAIGPVRIINARDGGPELNELKALGFDIDEGMALCFQGEIYHGDACIHMLALLSEARNPLSYIINKAFRRKGLARSLYPWMRVGRNFTLKLLGRRKINGEKF